MNKYGINMLKIIFSNIKEKKEDTFDMYSQLIENFRINIYSNLSCKKGYNIIYYGKCECLHLLIFKKFILFLK